MRGRHVLPKHGAGGQYWNVKWDTPSLRVDPCVVARRGVTSCGLVAVGCGLVHKGVRGSAWLSVVAASVSGMSQLIASLRHPVVACVDGLEALLDQVAELDPGYLATAEKADALVRLTRAGGSGGGAAAAGDGGGDGRRRRGGGADGGGVVGAADPGHHPVPARARAAGPRAGPPLAAGRGGPGCRAGVGGAGGGDRPGPGGPGRTDGGRPGRPRPVAGGRGAPGGEGRGLHATGAAGAGGPDPGGGLPRGVRRPGTPRAAGRGTAGVGGDPADPARPRGRVGRPAGPDPGSGRGPVADLPGGLHRTPTRLDPHTDPGIGRGRRRRRAEGAGRPASRAGVLRVVGGRGPRPAAAARRHRDHGGGHHPGRRPARPASG